MTLNESIISKIQKLLALGQSPNEAEASLAMARAQELLARYNLDMALVNAQAAKSGGAENEKRETTRISRSARLPWQRDLWRAIAEANFCWYSVVEVFEGKRGAKGGSKVRVKRHCVLGREANVISVRLMGEYLEDAIERLVKNSGGFSNAERMSNAATSWKMGAADRLIERIHAQAEERKGGAPAANAASTALVLRDVYQSEYAANYNAHYGAGAYEAALERRREYNASAAEREKLAERARIRAEEEWAAYLSFETPKQRTARLRRDELQEIKNRKTEQRERERMWREFDRKTSSLDSSAYRAGQSAANDINIGSQIQESTNGRLK